MSPLFDKAVFDALSAELGEDDTAEALAAFLEDTAGKMARLAANFEARPLVKLEAHSIKSSAGTFGFADLSRLARELESSVATLEPAKLRQSVGELQRTFEKTRHFAQENLLIQT